MTIIINMNHLTNISSNYNQPPQLSPYFTFTPFLHHIYTHHHESHSITLFPSISPITAMGFPIGYTDLHLPKLFLHLLTLLGLIRKLISSIFRFVGLSDFLEPEFSSDPTRNEHVTHFHSISAVLIRELLPVVKFSELVDPPESCAVCLYEFESGDEIRQLINCRHIFHQCCLDRWMDHDQKTCPLCRTTFVPDDLRDSFNERLFRCSRSRV